MSTMTNAQCVRHRSVISVSNVRRRELLVVFRMNAYQLGVNVTTRTISIASTDGSKVEVIEGVHWTEKRG